MGCPIIVIHRIDCLTEVALQSGDYKADAVICKIKENIPSERCQDNEIWVLTREKYYNENALNDMATLIRAKVFSKECYKVDMDFDCEIQCFKMA